jgi:hypothetical protein
VRVARPEQFIAGVVSEAVVEVFQSDDINVRDRQPCIGPAAPIDFVFQVCQARRARSCAGQRVGFGDLNLLHGKFPIRASAQPLLGSLLAVLCRGATILGGQYTVLGRLSAMLRGAGAVLSGALDDLHTEVRPPAVLLIRGVSLRHRQIACVGGLIARERREVTSVGNSVAHAGRVQTRSSGLLTLMGGALTDVTGDLMFTRIHAGREVAIARRLVAVGSDLIAVRARLIAVRTRLIGV